MVAEQHTGFSLSMRNTNILKGIAICAMLIHHIYACPPDGYGPFGPVLSFLGGLGKCCVAIFLFCSGYGLAVKYSQESCHTLKSSVKFVLRRLLKFYSNYWFIFLIFVPIGVFIFDIPLSARYGGHANLINRLGLDLLGIQGFNSYNITWWFNKLIILLYFAFPLLFLAVKKLNWWMLPVSLIVSRLSTTSLLNFANYYDLLFWQFPFVMGLLWRRNEESLEVVCNWVKSHRVVTSILTLVVLGIAVACRMYHIIPHYNGLHLDTYIAVLSAILTVVVLDKLRISSALALLGRHSANIYLTHTFIGGYWFPSLLYGKLNFVGGASIFIIEMSICLLISIIIEEIKKYSKYNALSKKVIQLI